MDCFDVCVMCLHLNMMNELPVNQQQQQQQKHKKPILSNPKATM